MFIDICYAGDEKKALDVAGRLGTKQLCFIYKKKPDPKYLGGSLEKKGKLTFSELEGKYVNKKNVIYYMTGVGKKNFHSPTKQITQVKIKEIVSRNHLIAIPFDGMLNGYSDFFERARFLIKICRKYDAPLIIASFAKDPYRLRAKKELYSFGKLIGMDTKMLQNSFSLLNDYLKKIYPKWKDIQDR